MPDEQLPTSLQESILAALAFDNTAAPGIAAQVKPEHFDQPYQEIATNLLEYRRQFHRAPGVAHLDDIFGLTLQRGEAATRKRRLLAGLTELASGLNPAYIASRVQVFIRAQTLKAAILRAGELYQGGGAQYLEEIEQTLFAAMRHRSFDLDAGTFLSDTDRVLRFLDRRAVSIPLGIPEFDKYGVGPTVGASLLYIAPKGTGKTWFCVHCGKRGLLHREKVMQISLEVDEEVISGRYMQSIFGGANRPDPYLVSTLELDELQRLMGWNRRSRRPNLSWRDAGVREVLRRKLQNWGMRLGAIVIKRFPSGQLTMSQLVSYMDYMETVHKFIPTMLIVDYPDLLKLDERNFRISLGRAFVDLRGLAVERSLSLVTPTQGQRATIGSKNVRAAHTSEDISKVFTADNVVTYSQTRGERELGLARLYAEHVRNDSGNLEVLITQSYATGQYVLESARMRNSYWDKLKAVSPAEDDEEESDDSA